MIKRLLGALLGLTIMLGLAGALQAVQAVQAPPAAATTYIPTAYQGPGPGDHSRAVMYLQLRLVKAKVLKKKYATSHYGSATTNAIKRFQRKVHLKDNGRLTRTTWKKLVAKTGKIKMPASLLPKQAKLTKRCLVDGRVLCADKTRHKLYYVVDGRIKKTLDARFGCSGSRHTREGTFKVYRKNKHWVSTVYHTAMPYSMFFSGGQAVHYSSDFAARGYAGCSHGCVNVRDMTKLKYLFAHVRVGDRVVVYRS